MNNLLYSVEREYPATIERVWKAWTKASELEKWYHPTDLLVVPNSAVSDLEIGGSWKIAIAVPQFEFVAYFFGWYSQIQLHTKLAHSLSYTQEETEFAAADQNAPSHLIEVDFEARGSGCWVRFSQFGEMPADDVEGSRVGMESYFQSLADYLEDADRA
mgnify:FL=1